MEDGASDLLQKPQVPRKLDLKILLGDVPVLHAVIWRNVEIYNQYRPFIVSVWITGF